MALCRGHDIPNWAIFLFSSVILLYIYLDIKFRYWRGRGVPSLNLWGYLKHMYDIFTKPIHEIFLKQYKKYGRIHGVFMATKPMLTVADPVLLKQIFVKDFHVFPNRIKFDAPHKILNDLLSILLDEKWKRVRSIISPTFSSGRMRKITYLVKDCAENLSKHCEEAAGKNEEINCISYYNTFSVEVLASTIFGTKLNTFENPGHPFLVNAKKMLPSGASVFFIIQMMFPKLFKIFAVENAFFRTLNYFKEFALHVVEERDKNNIRANDLLQLMLDAQRGKLEKTEEDGKDEQENTQPQIITNDKTITIDELLAQCIVFLMAGEEKITTTLAFFSYYMALHPKIQDRLLKEVDEAWEAHKEINYDVLNKLTYLDAVLSEVLRMNPAVIQILRFASQDYKLGDTGIIVEKDVLISVPVQAIHLDPEFFPEPEQFDPERFMPENRKKIQPYTYIPFGEGPRNCIAMRFALMQLKLCMIYLLRRIRFEATENTKKPIRYYLAHNVQPKEILVRFVKRN